MPSNNVAIVHIRLRPDFLAALVIAHILFGLGLEKAAHWLVMKMMKIKVEIR